MKPVGADMIYAERKRQLTHEGWTPEHDARHEDESLVAAAICYALNKTYYHKGRVITGRRYEDADCGGYREVRSASPLWPWDAEWDKREKHGRIRSLVIAGALLAAEIDRLSLAR